MRLRYTLRSLLLLFVALSGWLAMISERANSQRAAVAVIRDMNGGVLYSNELARGPRSARHIEPLGESEIDNAGWLERAVGRDWFHDVVFINLHGCDVSPDVVASVSRVKSLEWLSLSDSRCSDHHLSALAPLPRLRTLLLQRTDVGSKSISTIAKCRSLEHLDLHSTRVSDENLQEIATLKKLTYVNLSSTAIGDRGVKAIAESSTIEYLDLSDTSISDDAIEYFKSMTSLRRLVIVHTRVSYNARRELCDCVPELDVEYHP